MGRLQSQAVLGRRIVHHFQRDERNVMKALVLAIICLFSVCDVGLAHENNPYTYHWEARNSFIKFQAASIGVGKPLLLGDSIIEGLWWNTLPESSCAIINGGFGGATLAELLRYSQGLLAATKPPVVTVLIGTNDASRKDNVEQWRVKYTQLISIIEKSGAVPVLMTIPPVEQAPPFGAKYFSIERIKAYNKYIRGEAKKGGYILVDLHRAFANDKGYAPSGSTFDGVHPVRR